MGDSRHSYICSFKLPKDIIVLWKFFFLFFTAILKGVYPYSREELAFPIYKFITYPLLCKTQLYSGVNSPHSVHSS